MGKHLPCTQDSVGSSPTVSTTRGPVAELAYARALEARAARYRGSSPCGSTTRETGRMPGDLTATMRGSEPRHAGSNPARATMLGRQQLLEGPVAQSEERLSCKQRVASSTLARASKLGLTTTGRTVTAADLVWDQEDGGSNPPGLTKKSRVARGSPLAALIRLQSQCDSGARYHTRTA
jgi:hypothetical protein